MILMGVGAYGMDYLGKYTIKAQEVLFAAASAAAPPPKARFTRAHNSVISVPVCHVVSLTERMCARKNWCVCSLSPRLMLWVYCCMCVRFACVLPLSWRFACVLPLSWSNVRGLRVCGSGLPTQKYDVVSHQK